jgi:hypothetical protein
MSGSKVFTKKEEIRVALVAVLIATIIGLRLYDPKVTTPVVSLIFGILLTYWSLYAFFTVYGISQTGNVKLSNTLLWLGDFSFNLALYFVALGIGTGIIMEIFRLATVLEWNYAIVWLFSVAGFIAPQITDFLHELWDWRQFPGRVKANWRKVTWNWFWFFLMSLPLLALQYYRYVS